MSIATVKKRNTPSAAPYVLEAGQRFSQSKLWELQRTYFEQNGPEAWRSGQVPHYVTSNPSIAKHYADLVFALFRDRARMGHGAEKVYLLELGGGSGRLCYHFLKALDHLCKFASFKVPDYCYILSDLAASNLKFWKEHPRFGPYIQAGTLDFARLDALSPEKATLEYAKVPIEKAFEQGPAIVIANYFFDSIPQDLFYINGYQIAECRTHLHCTTESSLSDPVRLLEEIELDYEYQPLGDSAYQNHMLNVLLESYRGKLGDTHLLFPNSGISCLQRLLRIMPKGMVLLSADKGAHRLEDWQGRTAPELVRHGSFSLGVNYNAIRTFCGLRGGLPLSSRQLHQHLSMHCMLFLQDPNDYLELRMAAERCLNDFGPDEFFSLKKAIERSIDQLQMGELLASIRLSGYDARLFGQVLPRLKELISWHSKAQALSLLKTCAQVWENYFPLGEDEDLAFEIGLLLFDLGFMREASTYFGLSEKIYGPSTGSLYNLSRCYAESGKKANAIHKLEELLRFDPDHRLAAMLLEQVSHPQEIMHG